MSTAYKINKDVNEDISIYIPQDATLHSLFYLETTLHVSITLHVSTTLHVSGGTTIHH